MKDKTSIRIAVVIALALAIGLDKAHAGGNKPSVCPRGMRSHLQDDAKAAKFAQAWKELQSDFSGNICDVIGRFITSSPTFSRIQAESPGAIPAWPLFVSQTGFSVSGEGGNNLKLSIQLSGSINPYPGAQVRWRRMQSFKDESLELDRIAGIRVVEDPGDAPETYEMQLLVDRGHKGVTVESVYVADDVVQPKETRAIDIGTIYLTGSPKQADRLGEALCYIIKCNTKHDIPLWKSDGSGELAGSPFTLDKRNFPPPLPSGGGQ